MNNIILCGFQYAGKTTLGKDVAQKLNKNFIDIDELILKAVFQDEQAHKQQRSRNLYHAMGAENFREFEQDLIKGLASTQNSIIATGGGSLLHPQNRKTFKKLGPIIYLDWPAHILKARILENGAGAFLNTDNLDESFKNLYEYRHPIFLQTADMQLKMEHETMLEASNKILTLVRKHYGQ